MNENSQTSRSAHFRSFIFRGLGVVLPPLLTIVVLIWAWNTIESYVLRPMESTVRKGVVWYQESWGQGVLEEIPANAITQGDNSFSYDGVPYVPGPTGRKYLPAYVVDTVDENADYFDTNSPPLNSANGYWHRYIQVQWMPRRIVIPIFLIVFVTVLYFVGRLFTFSLGRWFVRAFDAAILRIPVVNKVYGSVKQVTDFAFSEREIEFNNVVAVQYPSKGIWSLGFVTGNSIKQLSDAMGEPMLSVLMPTSPMPMTGFTVTVRRSDTIDVDMTVDEAIQFVVSCGVVVPPNQRVIRNAAGEEARPKAKYRDGAVVLPSNSTAEGDRSTV
ncbi:DUF502 domain-containing protein [Rhodopirellula sp. MGV]|uniref:DUF502 domain-containing protein n=1 Tax=Rhodopirellula sp. MGV TaxID=2023130 RepID=UPI000B95D196|nr:DUF502 domain-containing protein [Rhodopirellula sp. MGV]OYP34716.1 hypothetical protein CGZ80_13875 [Rhodopirellula sp. MGV]PNY34329.1 DUF502 domain-containing protein [Rhodopirellula baltica]